MKTIITAVALLLSLNVHATTVQDAQRFLDVHHPGYTVTKIEWPLLRTKQGETFRVMEFAGRQVAMKCSAFKKTTGKSGC